MPRVNNEWGVWVQGVLDEHGLGYRQQTIRTGLNHVTVMNMVSGVVPGFETVVRFARGMGIPVNDALRKAGYDPIPADELEGESPFDADAYLARQLRCIYEETGEPVAVSFSLPPEPTKEQVDEYIADLRQQLAEESAARR